MTPENETPEVVEGELVSDIALIDQDELGIMIDRFKGEAEGMATVVATLLEGVGEQIIDAAANVQYAADVIAITDEATMNDAASYRKKMGTLGKEMETLRKACSDPFETHKKEIIAVFKPLTTACDEGRRVVGKKVMVFEDKVAEEARLREAKLAEQAEKQRIRDEVKADKLEEEGKEHQADAFRTKAAATVAPTIAPPRAQGMHRRKTWVATVEDPAAFIKAAHDQLQRELGPGEVSLLTYLNFDMAALKKLATSSDGAVQIPGIKFSQGESAVG